MNDDMSEISGHIQLIIGPMFSGKTTELLRRIRRYTIAKRRCLVIKYEADVRYSDECAATHDNFTHAAVSCSVLRSVTSKLGAADLSAYDVVGIDEGQFYPDLLEFSEELANQGKIVVISALDATFQRQPFGAVVQLIPMAERVDKLSAVCMVCQNAAAFTSRIGSETAVEVIGGADKYISTCRRCFHLADKRPHSVAELTAAHSTPARAPKAVSTSPSTPAERLLSLSSPFAGPAPAGRGSSPGLSPLSRSDGSDGCHSPNSLSDGEPSKRLTHTPPALTPAIL